MKRYSLLFAFIICSISYSQNSTFYNIKKNKNCHSDHRCKLKFTYDEANKSCTYKTADIGLAEVSRHSDKTLDMSFIKIVDKDKNVVIAAVFTGKIKDCTNKDSYVSLLLMNGNRVKLQSIQTSKDCHSNYLMVNLSEEDFVLMTESGIKKARLHYVNKEEDFDVDSIGQKLAIEALTCIDTVEN